MNQTLSLALVLTALGKGMVLLAKELTRNESRAAAPLMRLCEPELREKFARQGTAGFGFFLDRHVNRSTERFYIAPLPGST